jgi:hypothetical protein
MGHPPSDNDMYAIALGSLPPSHDSYISAVSAMSSVLGTTISADALMTTITDKYNCRLLNSKGGKKDDNVTFHTNKDFSKSQKGGLKKDVKCYNCHKKGHYKADCWAERGGKEGQGPKIKGRAKGKAKDMTAAVAAKEKVEEKVEAWMVSLAVIDKPELSFDAADLSCGSNLSDDDWFEEMDLNLTLLHLVHTDSAWSPSSVLAVQAESKLSPSSVLAKVVPSKISEQSLSKV